MSFFSGLFKTKLPVPSNEQKREMLTDLGERMKKLLPDEKIIGQPFWGLMEIRNNQVTGNYFRLPNNGPLPIFVSKYHAESFLSQHPDSVQKSYVVRGLTQEQIRLLANTTEEIKGFIFAIFLHPENGSQWYVRQIDGKMLRSEFVWD